MRMKMADERSTTAQVYLVVNCLRKQGLYNGRSLREEKYVFCTLIAQGWSF